MTETPRTVDITVIDAFTPTPFAGNPAAVCLLDTPPPEAWMRAVAAEMNLSETAFLVPAGDGRWSLRWFTPATEVDLCGHATLASARFLADAGHLTQGGTARFDTRSGELQARLEGDRLALDLPAIRADPAEPMPGLLEALGLTDAELVASGRSGHFVVVEVAGADRVVGLEPSFAALAALDLEIVVVTAAGGDDADVTSRVFGPAIGIDEDPVTGAAHCLLAPWFADRLGDRFRAHQASARGGRLEVVLHGDRVELLGHAAPVWSGQIVGW